MSNVREWLPAGHLTSDKVRGAIADVVATWSDAWFGRAVVRASVVRIADGSLQRAAWAPCGVGRVCLPRGGGRRLALLALDAGPDQVPVTDADIRLVEDFEARLLADLGSRLSEGLGVGDHQLEGTCPDNGDLIVALWVENEELGQLAIARCDIVALVRRLSPAGRAGVEALTARRHAIGPKTVRLQARVGAATLTLDEVRNLAIGDVLVLDTALDQPIPLLLESNETFIASGRMTRLDDHMALSLER